MVAFARAQSRGVSADIAVDGVRIGWSESGEKSNDPVDFGAHKGCKVGRALVLEPVLAASGLKLISKGGEETEDRVIDLFGYPLTSPRASDVASRNF